MDKLEYGEELLNTGALTYKRNSRQFQNLLCPNYYMQWPSCSYVFLNEASEEDILLVSSNQRNYKSALHFAWKVIFYEREIDNKVDIREIFEGSDGREANLSEVLEIIQKISPRWFSENSGLLCDAKKAYLIWEDSLDLYFVFEIGNNYVAWNWSSTA